MKLVETLSGFEDRATSTRYEGPGIRFQCDDDRAGALVKQGLVKIIEHNIKPPRQQKGPAPENKAAVPAVETKDATPQPEAELGEPQVRSLQTMRKPELLELAEAYGLDVSRATPREKLITLIEQAKKE